MVSSPYLVAKNAAEPHGTQAEQQLSGGIEEREKAFAVAPQVHCLVAEDGEGREPTQDADDDERARCRGEGPASLGELRQEADDETPEDIDGERPYREILAPGPVMHQTTQQIAKNRANEPAQANEQNLAHADV